MPDRLCVDRTCTICETLLWCPAWRGLVWSAVVYPSVTLGPLTRAHQAVVYMQISQSALSQDIVNICWSPLSSHSRTTDFSPKHPCYCYTERRYLIRTSDCWLLVSRQGKMTSLSSLTPELAVSQSHVLPSRSGRQMFGNSKEVDWAIGGAALGFTVAIVEYIANNVFDR